jgi:GNAT superfamily N-acetyltransferase
MPLITIATPDDLPALAALRAAEGWALHEWLLNLVCRWEGGRIFVVRAERAPDLASASAPSASRPLIAATSAVAYGTLGFVGNVIVHHAYRRQGLGKQLMRAAIDWLADQGARAVELDATPEGRPLYSQLGFAGAAPTWFLWTPLDRVNQEHIATLAVPHDIRPLDANGLGALAALDQLAFGGNRLGLLDGVLQLPDTRAYVAHEPGSAPAGYLIVRPLDPPQAGLRLGPWIARTPATAAALLAHALRAHDADLPAHPDTVPYIAASVPGESRAVRALYATLDLPLVEDDLHMRLELPQPAGTHLIAHAHDVETPGPALGQPEWVYAMLAPMVG